MKKNDVFNQKKNPIIEIDLEIIHMKSRVNPSFEFFNYNYNNYVSIIIIIYNYNLYF